MPANFDKCVSDGGRIRTKTLSGGRYMHICFPKGGGPGIAGEVKTKQKGSHKAEKKSDGTFRIKRS